MPKRDRTIVEPTAPGDRIARRSVQQDDVGASIVLAVMQLNNVGGSGACDAAHRNDFIEVIKNGRLITYPPGTTIIQRGETDDCLYVILEGSVVVHTPEGAAIRLDKGSLVGQMAPLTEEPRNATVVAGDRMVSALAINKETLFANPSVYHSLLGNGLRLQGKTGTYELGRKLGEGMTAKVYAVHGDRYCAKVYKNVLRFEGDYVAKFIAETFLALKHPNIINVYELTEAYGTHFLIMDRARGVTVKKKTGEVVTCMTLRQLIALHRAEGLRIGVARCGDMLRQIGGALQYTHRHGYVHRDVKPENIFLDVRDGRIAFLLADFGLALPIDTRPEKIAGTPQYMAPETVDIENPKTRIGAAADFYALAVVCFEMLTGRRLFSGSGILEVVRQHLYEQPDLSRLPADTPKPLRRFIERSLRKNPEERPSPDEAAAFFAQACEEPL